MKNSILNLGKTLNKAEQKQINGGIGAECATDKECWLASGNSLTECIDGNCAFKQLYL